MEFLRFGSSIPGGYWGCCAMCIIQNFKFDPDAKASIEIVSGDGGQPLGDNFAGLTYREVFETRLRIGTFNTNDMPNHGFLAILTDWQVNGNYGSKWLKILKDNGFEFIRAMDNSVYSGPSLLGELPDYDDDECEEYEGDSTNKNYLFGLFRNIGNGAVADPLAPPPAWTNLDGGCINAVDMITPRQRAKVASSQQKYHRKAWDKLGSPKFYTKAQVKEAGVPLTFAGQRSKLPQQSEEKRKAALKAQKKATPAKAAPFGAGDAVVEAVG